MMSDVTFEDISTPEVMTEHFITEMLNETGCSIRFLNEAKPILLKLFQDTSGVARDNCLNEVSATIKAQADMERQSAELVASAKRGCLKRTVRNEELQACLS